jgi:hypothetical protein
VNTDHVYTDALKGLLALALLAAILITVAWTSAFISHVIWNALVDGWDVGEPIFK